MSCVHSNCRHEPLNKCLVSYWFVSSHERLHSELIKCFVIFWSTALTKSSQTCSESHTLTTSQNELPFINYGNGMEDPSFVICVKAFCSLLHPMFQARQGPIDDATLQLVPCYYRFKLPRFEEQNVNIYLFKSLCRHQSFQQKSLDGHSCSAVSIKELFRFTIVSLVPVWVSIS